MSKVVQRSVTAPHRHFHIISGCWARSTISCVAWGACLLQWYCT